MNLLTQETAVERLASALGVTALSILAFEAHPHMKTGHCLHRRLVR